MSRPSQYEFSCLVPIIYYILKPNPPFILDYRMIFKPNPFGTQANIFNIGLEDIGS